jgi:hypothetical protein
MRSIRSERMWNAAKWGSRLRGNDGFFRLRGNDGFFRLRGNDTGVAE